MDTGWYPGNFVIHFLATVKSWEEGWGVGLSLAVCGLLWPGSLTSFIWDRLKLKSEDMKSNKQTLMLKKKKKNKIHSWHVNKRGLEVDCFENLHLVFIRGG